MGTCTSRSVQLREHSQKAGRASELHFCCSPRRPSSAWQLKGCAPLPKMGLLPLLSSPPVEHLFVPRAQLTSASGMTPLTTLSYPPPTLSQHTWFFQTGPLREVCTPLSQPLLYYAALLVTTVSPLMNCRHPEACQFLL